MRLTLRRFSPSYLIEPQYNSNTSFLYPYHHIMVIAPPSKQHSHSLFLTLCCVCTHVKSPHRDMYPLRKILLPHIKSQWISPVDRIKLSCQTVMHRLNPWLDEALPATLTSGFRKLQTLRHARGSRHTLQIYREISR